MKTVKCYLWITWLTSGMIFMLMNPLDIYLNLPRKILCAQYLFSLLYVSAGDLLLLHLSVKMEDQNIFDDSYRGSEAGDLLIHMLHAYKYIL